MDATDPLELFLPPVREWFRRTLGEPTPAQRQGWPAIAAGQNTLILAPTGSGKTLAAFLACLDGLWRQQSRPSGVQVLYVSPLKALNNDIYRNLQVPLAGVAETARRLGLSATQRPLDEVARYLGGSERSTDGRFVPRAVTVVDAGLRKELDLRVVSPVEQFGPLPEKSIWPSIYRLLGDEIRSHRSTLVFVNNRRQVERITANLNDPEEIARAHHGSVSLEARQQTEQALKEGRLPAVVATASLELGIDMGAVDLVCQVESPGSVARGLQRVGRAGHLVGQRSKGRPIPKIAGDLLEQAVLAREMGGGHFA